MRIQIRECFGNTGEAEDTDLEHGKKQVLFATLILISVDGEHDGL